MNQSSILFIIGAIVLFGAAGYLLFGQTDLTVVTASSSEATQAEITFLALSAQIDPFTFNPKIIEDPRFQALQDISVTILEEAAGRVDPFAPLSK